MDPSLTLSAAAAEAHTASAANPSPHTAIGPSSHPPYAEMITAAIKNLKEEDGSSLTAIGKYIQDTYTDLPAYHATHLVSNIKKMKNSGVIQMVKHTYKLADPFSTPKIGRGRPPKRTPVPTPVSEPDVDANPTAAALGSDGERVTTTPTSEAKRGPGRPPKGAPVTTPVSEPNVDVNPASVALGSDGERVTSTPTSEAKRGRGRPSKGTPTNAKETVGSSGGSKRRGRPPKHGSGVTDGGLSSSGTKRGRERPKVSSPSITPDMASGGISVPGSSGKRRGRPSKQGVPTKSPGKSPGRSVGRPKKSTHPAKTSDLKMVLEHFQSKIKQAIGVLKPTNEDIMAAAALDDLEKLAEMDVDAPIAAKE